MTTSELLNTLRIHNILLECEGDALMVDMPEEEELSPDLHAAILEHKAVLLALLTAQKRLRPIEDDLAQSEKVPSEEVPPADDQVQPKEVPLEEVQPADDRAQPEEVPLEDDLIQSKEAPLENDLAQPEEVPSEDKISIECYVCGAEVEYYSEQGIAYCQTHWDVHLQSLVAPWLVEQAPTGQTMAQSSLSDEPDPHGGTALEPDTITPAQPLEPGTITPLTDTFLPTHPTRVGTSLSASAIYRLLPAEHEMPVMEGKEIDKSRTRSSWSLPSSQQRSVREGTIPSAQPLELDTITSAQEIRALGARWDRTPPARLVLDLETTGLNPRTDKVITLAIGIPGDVTIIDLRGYYRADPVQQQAWREALQQLLQRDALLWIGHNLKFDWSFLAQQFGVRLTRVYDTMLVEKLLHVGERVRVSLQASAARYGIEVSKEARSWFIELDTRPSEWDAALPEAQLAYMRQDIAVPYQLYEQQLEAIKRQDLVRVAFLEQQVLPAIAAIEVHGVCVDRERWRDILASGHKQKEALERQIKPILGQAQVRIPSAQASLFGEMGAPEINLGSSQQVMQALYRLGIRPRAFSKEALQAVQHLHRVVPLVLEWKALEKFESAFGANLLSYVTAEGRIHATFDQLGAASGRVVCREPNLQQIPKPAGKDDPYDLRRCFIAPQGHRFLIADLSNIELRILAEVSGDPIMQRFFAEGKDLHSETARLMFKLPPEVDPKEHQVNGKKARDIAKTINFGLAYGMGAQGLASRVGVDLARARELMQTYLTTYKGVSEYLKRSGKEGVTCGYAMSLSGRKRFFAPDELKTHRDEVERSAKNHPIQGTNADILKYALALLYRRLPPEVHIVLIIHDEIVLECPCERVTDATQILQDALMQACRVYLKVVHIPDTEVLEAAYWRKD